MNVLYKCSCLNDEASFEVREREADEDVMDWMQGPVNQALIADHKLRSPHCKAIMSATLKIPLQPNAPHFAGKPVLHS
jgi:hypothetical protein